MSTWGGMPRWVHATSHLLLHTACRPSRYQVKVSSFHPHGVTRRPVHRLRTQAPSIHPPVLLLQRIFTIKYPQAMRTRGRPTTSRCAVTLQLMTQHHLIKLARTWAHHHGAALLAPTFQGTGMRQQTAHVKSATISLVHTTPLEPRHHRRPRTNGPWLPRRLRASRRRHLTIQTIRHRRR